MEEISKVIDYVLKNVEMDDSAKKLLTENLNIKINEKVELYSLKTKLEILYNYEKNYLELVKEFKEEIKFASSIQEDLRKERAKFFAETLKEVQSTLKDSQVDSKVASNWVEELVNSYTKSLDLCGGLIEEHTLDTIGRLRQEAKQEVKKSELK
ncbi:MAG: nickel transporter [Campylobacterota bacterium]|nr:nickel transporter [Campylobacterota bacterium]